ncbi:MAG TPA: hypothetical protein VJ853_13645 [Thermoanaerobaculia bacterium]|nr:hypothetical protein [Thermoanaerobaculia bacterium]
MDDDLGPKWRRLERVLEDRRTLTRDSRSLLTNARALMTRAAALQSAIAAEMRRMTALKYRSFGVVSIDDDSGVNEIVAATSALLGLQHLIATTRSATATALSEGMTACVMASPRFGDAIGEAIDRNASVVLTPTREELTNGLRGAYEHRAKGMLLRPFAESDLLDVIGAFALIGLGRRG